MEVQNRRGGVVGSFGSFLLEKKDGSLVGLTSSETFPRGVAQDEEEEKEEEEKEEMKKIQNEKRNQID